MASQSLINQLSQSFYNADGTPNDRLDKYCSRDVQRIIIDGNEFTGYKTYTFFWEKTYVSEPVRSSGGVISDLNSYATFITPHLQIKFSLMSMEDYRRLYALILSKNEFLVTCYNPLTNETTTNRMYFYPDSLPKLNMIARNIFNQGAKEKWIELLGVQDYTIELVGTIVDTEKIEVIYLGKNDEVLGSKTVEKNSEFLVGNGISVPNVSGYSFTGLWQRVGVTSDAIPNNTAVFAILERGEQGAKTITYKAQYSDYKEYTLSLAWGLGEAVKDKDSKDITAIKFRPSSSETVSTALSRNKIQLLSGGTLSSLPLSVVPTITVDKTEYPTHKNLGWKKGSTKEYTSVTNSTVLNVEANLVFYQVFEPVKHYIKFDSNGGTEFSTVRDVEYNSSVALPTPKYDGYSFGGWYTDDKFENKFNGLMPPYDITLYAKWS